MLKVWIYDEFDDLCGNFFVLHMRCKKNYIELLCIYPTCLYTFITCTAILPYGMHTHFFFGMLSHIFRQNRMNHITNPWGSAMAAAGVLKALESVSWDATHELCSIVRHLKIFPAHVHITHLNRVDIWQILQAAVQKSAMMTFALLRIGGPSSIESCHDWFQKLWDAWL